MDSYESRHNILSDKKSSMLSQIEEYESKLGKNLNRINAYQRLSLPPIHLPNINQGSDGSNTPTYLDEGQRSSRIRLSKVLSPPLKKDKSAENILQQLVENTPPPVKS